MKTIYVSRSFTPCIISAHTPGDAYRDPVLGDCRRLTAKRLCLLAERAGKESDALQGVLNAIVEAAKEGVYDGRDIDSWYGLVGMGIPCPPNDGMVRVKCPECKAWHWALEEYGCIWDNGICGECASRKFIVAKSISGRN